MNPTPSRHDPAVDEQAAYWAARLDGGDVLDASERTALDAWLSRSPAHRAALSDYCQFSADLEEQLPALVKSGAVAMPIAPRPARRRFWMPVFSGFALAAAAAVAVVVWLDRHPAPSAFENVVTAIAQRSTHTLSDGTRVELNARTSIRFDNTGDLRRVRLAGGEALFQVAKDRSRPFVIETPHGSVQVTGTTFNVRDDLAGTASSLEVTVVEGSVNVRPSDSTETYALAAGDQLLSGSAGVRRQNLSETALANALAWRDGYVVFEGTPLSEAAARFSRYHGRRIVVEPSVGDLKVGAYLRLDDFDGFLGALEAQLSVKATHDDLSGAVSIGARPGS